LVQIALAEHKFLALVNANTVSCGAKTVAAGAQQWLAHSGVVLAIQVELHHIHMG
jgi:phage gp46-like protein